MLLKTNWEKKEIIWNGDVLKLEQGQFITGRLQLSKETGIKPSTIEDILKYLEKQQQIRQQSNNKFRIITIVNWKEYQEKTEKSDSKSDNQPTTKRQQSDTDKNEKNNKNKKNTCSFDIFWKEYPRKTGKKKAQQSWERINPDQLLVEKILNSLKEHKEAQQWLKHGGEFIPFPATWLNQERWNDEVIKGKAPEKKPYYKGNPMVWNTLKKKWFVVINAEWFEFNDKENTIEYK